jgi:hypothetical protein
MPKRANPSKPVIVDLHPQLFDSKLLGISIKHDLFPRGQKDIHETSSMLKSLPRNTLNKEIPLQYGGPYNRKIISLAYQFGAMSREIARFLSRHLTALEFNTIALNVSPRG